MGKIRLRHGQSEIELEGDEDFIERQLANFYARFKIDQESTTRESQLLGPPDVNRKEVSPAEYLRALGASSADAKSQLLVLGKFLETHRQQADFSPKELNSLAKEAKLSKDFHPQRFADAVAQGFLRLDNNRYSLTGTADEFLSKFPRETKVRPSRKRSTTRNTPIDKSTPTASKNARSKTFELEKFDTNAEGDKPSLADFFAQKKPGSAVAQRVAVLAYYITRIRGADNFSEGNIDYAYRLLNLKGRPRFLRQILINNKNKNDWFDFTADKSRLAANSHR